MQQPVKSQLITFSCLQTDKKNSCCALPITAICLAGDGVQLLGCAAVIAVGKTYFYVDKSFEKWLYSNNNNVKLNKQKAE
jgi:hypothetical protein